jgi:hypothetical protein
MKASGGSGFVVATAVRPHFFARDVLLLFDAFRVPFRDVDFFERVAAFAIDRRTSSIIASSSATRFAGIL